MKSNFRSASFNRKFRITNLMIGRSKKNRKKCSKKAFEQRNKGTKELGLKFDHGLALIGLRTS